MELKDQARLCSLQMQQLEESVNAYEKHKGIGFVAGYETPRNAQQNRTAIYRQVVALRQSLLALAKEVGR